MAPKYSQWEKWESRQEAQSLKIQADSDSEGQGRDPVPTWETPWGSVGGLEQKVYSWSCGFSVRGIQKQTHWTGRDARWSLVEEGFHGQGTTERQASRFI